MNWALTIGISIIILFDIVSLVLKLKKTSKLASLFNWLEITAISIFGVKFFWYGVIEKQLIQALWYVSIALTFVSLYIFIKYFIVKDKPISAKILNYTMFYGAIWCLRYAVGYYAKLNIAPSDNPLGNSGLNWFEEGFNSLLHTLQTMSLDEGYTEYIDIGNEMFSYLGWNPTVHGVYASCLNILAPIVGGLIIFEVFTNIFTAIKLLTIPCWKHKYYFSELNERSLALAKSIRDTQKKLFTTPACIFTDAYSDKGDEKKTELLSEAKSCGFICVNDDILHIKKSKLGKRTYILMDEKESANLHSLADLVGDSNRDYLMTSSQKRVNIYVFSAEDISAQKMQIMDMLLYVEKDGENLDCIKKALKNKDELSDDEVKRLENKKKELEEEKERIKAKCPVITVVNSYRNLMTNLFCEIPLYQPLISRKKLGKNKIDKSDNQILDVTVLGVGYIGMEAVLSAYWMGQMLGCKLRINVISKETDTEFYDKLNAINPEILQNSTVIRGTKASISRPYCEIQYVECDIKDNIFVQNKGKKKIKQILYKTDYFVVSLGTDMDNMMVAEKLRREFGKKAQEDKNQENNVIITYAIYDSDMCDALNFKNTKNKVDGVYMHAFGGLKKVYSADNIFMEHYNSFATGVNAGYDRSNRTSKKAGEGDTDYTLWASLARSMHDSYKLFSVGLLDDCSIFYNTEEEVKNKVSSILVSYMYSLIGPIDNLDLNTARAIMNKRIDLAWLEHRRWNAFTRVMGYRRLNKITDDGNQKIERLKLHGCLVETKLDVDKETAYDSRTLILKYNGIRKNKNGILDGYFSVEERVPDDAILLQLNSDTADEKNKKYEEKINDVISLKLKKSEKSGLFYEVTVSYEKTEEIKEQDFKRKTIFTDASKVLEKFISEEAKLLSDKEKSKVKTVEMTQMSNKDYSKELFEQKRKRYSYYASLFDEKANGKSQKDCPLNALACEIYKKCNDAESELDGVVPRDFKVHDFPESEFTSNVTVEDALKFLNSRGWKREKLIKMCKKNKIKGAIKLGNDKGYLIPKDSIKGKIVADTQPTLHLDVAYRSLP